MLQPFIAWAQSIPNAQITVATPSANPSALLDLDSSETMGRITCWETGDFHAEVLDTESGETIYSYHGNLDSYTRLAEQFLPFMQAMGFR